ncbi:fibroblast growth factor receptor substrate 3 isoform X2 [Cataglyphis hispanica]|uniref:fibroblast growth factor receptor substrate 3 isoform X2 n=1 Tax=Cataglyphis hispanica TaxID=1086592 RepID=UPI0021809027|nr:fibroblast growth factor receptor substrate 3 isoform X2 [Cataglyphis hispanica]
MRQELYFIAPFDDFVFLLFLDKRRMGCVNSRTNVFQVTNVNDQGKPIARGRLEITEIDIIFHQNSKQPTIWPLRCLRRYGYDSELFSFESGRRCPTGEGIYAFKCKKARDLFNLVQMKIQVSKNGDDALSRDLSIASHPTPAVPRVAVAVEPNYLDPISNRSNSCMDSRISHSQQNGIGRLSSIGSSSDPISPQGTVGSPSPPPMLPLPPPISQPHPSSYVNEEVLSSGLTEHNNNKNLERAIQRSPQITAVENVIFKNGRAETELIPVQPSAEATNCDPASPLPIKAPYMNIDICSETICNRFSPTHSTSETYQFKEESNLSGSQHAYINVSPGQDHVEKIIIKARPSPLPVLQPNVEEISKHCYYNLEANESQNLKKRFSGTSSEKSPLAPSTPTKGLIREMNYAILDLNKKEDLPGMSDNNVNSPPSPPESPNKPQIGYVTIDFEKTVALSHPSIVNPNHDNEGSRKTRHNSTIDDLVTTTCKHNSSIKFLISCNKTLQYTSKM